MSSTEITLYVYLSISPCIRDDEPVKSLLNFTVVKTTTDFLHSLNYNDFTTELCEFNRGYASYRINLGKSSPPSDEELRILSKKLSEKQINLENTEIKYITNP